MCRCEALLDSASETKYRCSNINIGWRHSPDHKQRMITRNTKVILRLEGILVRITKSPLVVKTIVVRKSHASKGASRFEFGAAHHINSQLRITDGCRKAHSLVCPFIWHYTSVIHPFEPLWKVTWPVPPSQGRMISNSGSFISLCHHFSKRLKWLLTLIVRHIALNSTE